MHSSSQGNIGLSTNCSKLLSQETAAKLGVGAVCRFRVSSEIAITLGSRATILPSRTAAPDVIRLAPSAIASASGQHL